MLIDSHAHLNFEEFKNDWQQIITDCQKKDIWLINVGAQLETSKIALEIANQYDRGVYAAVGLHPIHVAGSNFHPEEFAEQEYRKLIGSSKKVVAIGETGFDFFHNDKNFEQQKEIFLKHLDLAKEFNLPIILHGRNSKDGNKDAYQEILQVIKRYSDRAIKGVIHCYGGTLQEAKKFLDQGYYIGFTGVITFPKTDKLAAIVKEIPLEKILIETDCPFLAPEPYRGKRNQPQYVRFVAKKIAEIKQIQYNKVIKQTSQNTINLFKLK